MPSFDLLEWFIDWHGDSGFYDGEDDERHGWINASYSTRTGILEVTFESSKDYSKRTMRYKVAEV